MNRIAIVTLDKGFAATVEREIGNLDMWEVLKYGSLSDALIQALSYRVEVFIIDQKATEYHEEHHFWLQDRVPSARLVLAIDADEITDADEDGAAGFNAVMLKSDAPNILEVLEEILFPEPRDKDN